MARRYAEDGPDFVSQEKPSHSDKPSKDRKKPFFPRSGSKLGILRAPGKPPRLGKPPMEATLPPGYCAVGMTPSTSADWVTVTDIQDTVACKESEAEQSAYAVSKVRTSGDEEISTGQYSLITAHPLEATRLREGSKSTQAPQKLQYPLTANNSRLNYVELDIVTAPPSQGPDGDSVLQSGTSAERVCYASIIPEAHLKDIRRDSDGSHT